MGHIKRDVGKEEEQSGVKQLFMWRWTPCQLQCVVVCNCSGSVMCVQLPGLKLLCKFLRVFTKGGGVPVPSCLLCF